MTSTRIALLSSCTIELLQRPLAAALARRGLSPDLWIGGFGQYRQDILDGESALYRHEPDVVALYLDGEDLFQDLLRNPLAPTAEQRVEHAASRAAEVQSLVDELSARLPRATILLNTVCLPPISALTGLEHNSEFGLHDAVAEYNRRLGAIAAAHDTVVIVDTAALEAWLGTSRWRDARMWYLARLRFSRAALDAIAEAYTAAICGKLGRIRKCIVLDLDNTLWGGIIGEDGFEGIRLGEDGIGRAFAEFQEQLLNLYRKGVLLAICSKNNPDDALQVIRRHPGMRLREEHFAALRINWNDKASNLRELAEELNIGLDSFVFIDDNPVERTWVRESIPEAFVPEWPSDPADYKTSLLMLAAQHFFKPRITAEDRKRGEAYQAQAARRKLESSGTSVEEFYRGLEMKVRIGRADSFTIPRIAQLTQKTNQFNVTTRRYTEAEIRAASDDPSTEVFWLELNDRFGPSGIVGVLILKALGSGDWLIDTFLLSCRVMGRTVEQAFLAAAVQQTGASRLVGEYRPTAKNAPVKDLYDKLGFAHLRDEGESRIWSLNEVRSRLAVPAWFEISIETDTMTAGSTRTP